MNVLLTGGAGYIGSHICNSLIDNGFKVSTIDNLSTGNVNLIPKKVEHINCDISDTKIVSSFINKNNFDVVMHLAAFTRVGESVKYPDKYRLNNFEKAKIEAETKRTLAEAEAYQKKVILQADNALAQKLDAEIEIQKLWADAFSKRKVPSTVFGSGQSGAPVGSDAEVKAFMQMLTLDAAKRLNYDRELSKTKNN